MRPSDFANAAYLLWQAPAAAGAVEGGVEGADQTIETFLVVVADFLFVDPLFPPARAAVRARTLPQFDLPGMLGFVSRLASELPPAPTGQLS